MSEKAIECLSIKDTSFSTCNLLMLNRPTIPDQSELYWKSIEDFLVFSATVACRRRKISRCTLIDHRLFAAVKPILMRIDDFDSPHRSFGQVLDEMRKHSLNGAREYAIANCNQEAQHRINR
jgi:hypothetical protein